MFAGISEQVGNLLIIEVHLDLLQGHIRFLYILFISQIDAFFQVVVELFV
jgi:hypothetical protein